MLSWSLTVASSEGTLPAGHNWPSDPVVWGRTVGTHRRDQSHDAESSGTDLDVIVAIKAN
jgi:hypothetical protein